MATILQCKFCNKPFQGMSTRICPECDRKIDEDFIKIRDYVYDNPGSFDIDAICEATEVEKKIALHLLKEGRLTISTPPPGSGVLAAFVCSVCKKPIPTGTMCDDCKNSLSSTLSSSLPQAPKDNKKSALDALRRPSAKMHIRDKDKRR